MSPAKKIRGMAWRVDRTWTSHEVVTVVLVSELISAAKREPNPYAIGHFLRAADGIREAVADGSSAGDLRRLRAEVVDAVCLPLPRCYRWLDAVTEHAEVTS